MGTTQASQSRAERGFARNYDRMNARAERGWLGRRRAQLVGELTGQVLEIGAGTGANLQHYRKARRVVATEPDVRRPSSTVRSGDFVTRP